MISGAEGNQEIHRTRKQGWQLLESHQKDEVSTEEFPGSHLLASLSINKADADNDENTPIPVSMKSQRDEQI